MAALAIPGVRDLIRPAAGETGSWLLANHKPSEIAITQTRCVAEGSAMMSEGKFREILSVYDTLFSPNSRWLAYLVDAIPAGRAMHQYYVYILDTTNSERRMVLETKAGPGLEAGFAWTGDETPCLFAPSFPAEVSQPGPSEGPAWDRAVKAKGQDPRVRPRHGGIAFRQVEGEGEEGRATVWFLAPGPDAKPQQLSPHGSTSGGMEWAPDGSRLAFLSPEQAEFGECVWTVAPGSPPQLLSTVPAAHIAWSPTGGAIAVKTQSDELVLLAVPEGRQIQKLETARDFAWAPDGRAIAYVATPDPNAPEGVYYLAMDTGVPRRLLQTKATGGWDFGVPRFSPDGQCVYVGGAAGEDVTGDGQSFDRSDRVLYRCDTKASATPVAVRGSAVRPVVSADGSYALIVAERVEGSSLWCIDLTSGAATEWGKVPVQKYAYELAWSPDGTRVAYESSLSIDMAWLGPKPTP